MKRTFEQWFKLVGEEIRKQSGLNLLDLPDCPYADWYERGMSPKVAAKKAIKGALE